jgi:hypothetical protein
MLILAFMWQNLILLSRNYIIINNIQYIGPYWLKLMDCIDNCLIQARKDNVASQIQLGNIFVSFRGGFSRGGEPRPIVSGMVDEII